MKSVPILVVALGVAINAGLLISRSFRNVPPVVSGLPEFESATFMPYVQGVCPVVEIEGVDSQRLRSIFEGCPMEEEMKEWPVIGELTLLREGAEVLKIGVFSRRSGPAPFTISGGECYSGYDEAAFLELLRSLGWVLTPRGWEQLPAR